MTSTRLLRFSLLVLLMVLWPAVPAGAEAYEAEHGVSRFALLADAAAEAPEAADEIRPRMPDRVAFSKGSWTFDTFATATSNINDRPHGNFVGGGVGGAYYFEDRWALRGELLGLFVDQAGDSAGAAGFSLLLRHHFYQEGRLSLFIEGGAGLLQSSVSIPDGDRDDSRDGTNFNFTPQASLGFTWALEERTHLFGGFRYLHISNAGTNGGDRNPGVDSIGGFMGIMFSF